MNILATVKGLFDRTDRHAAPQTLADILARYPETEPLDQAAAEVLAPYRWSEFVAALGDNPSEESLRNAAIRFRQAVEVLAWRVPTWGEMPGAQQTELGTVAEVAAIWRNLDNEYRQLAIEDEETGEEEDF